MQKGLIEKIKIGLLSHINTTTKDKGQEKEKEIIEPIPILNKEGKIHIDENKEDTEVDPYNKNIIGKIKEEIKKRAMKIIKKLKEANKSQEKREMLLHHLNQVKQYHLPLLGNIEYDEFKIILSQYML